MKQFFNIIMEKFFSILAGTIILSIVVISLQISINFGNTIAQSTISMGWVMVAIWMGLITMLSFAQINKNSENN